MALLAGCAAAKNDTADVDRFVKQRTLCDHFRGELPDPQDKARLAEVIQKANETCKGTDGQLKALKKRYANDPAVMSKLNQFEEDIE